MQTIGIVGVGNMGLAMAERLLQAGHPVVVRDLLPEREALAVAQGATVAEHAAALAARCDVVLVVVVDGAQVREVLFGAHGVLQASRLPATVLLCPTIAPHDTEAAAQGLAAAGIACLDAPMSGGPVRARDGSMSLMLAGDPAVLARHDGLLATLAAYRLVVGTRVGDGARTKLVNNLLAAINLAGVAQALALAQQLGLDAARTLAVIECASGQSWIGSDRMRRALDGDTRPQAHLRLLAKDSALAMAMAAAAGVAPTLGAAAAQVFRQACEDGLADADDSALLAWSRPGNGATGG
jgi:L-threonate 2-dehydrogenase